MTHTLKASVAAMFLCSLLAWGCNEEENTPTDEGQVTDVHQETDTATGIDTAVGTDTNQGDTIVVTDVPDANQGTDAADDADTTGETTGEDGNDDPEVADADAFSNTVTFDECPTQGNIVLPWVSEFDIGGDMAANGWTIIKPQAIASTMWDLATSAMDFGTNTGRYAKFLGGEGRVSRTGLASTCLDASVCAPSSTVTLQWRMQYLHADPSKAVTLKAVAIHGTDLDAGEILWTATVTEDIAYDLYSVELPAALANTNGIRIALVLEFPDESALATEKWSIDHLVLSCGKPNHLVKTIMYTCPEGETACTPTSGTQIGEPIPADNPVSLTLDYCAHDLIVLCGYDEDAAASTWQMYGFPLVYADPMPSAQYYAMNLAASVGTGGGCETLQAAVESVCGTPATTVNGYFYCAMEVNPACNNSYLGTWPVGIVLRDEYEHTGVSPLHSPLESLTPVTIEATYTPAK